MSGRVVRDFRRQANQVAKLTVDALVPGVEAALSNEQLTRQRVEALELWRGRSLKGRLTWLLLGR